MTNTITFQPDEWGEVLAVIDGIPITKIIADHEVSTAAEDENNIDESSDVAFNNHDIHRGDTVANLPLTSREKAILLICSCGESGCSSTLVDMEVTDTQVLWSNIRTWITKNEPYPNLGPWTFDRKQYQTACDELHERLKQNT